MACRGVLRSTILIQPILHHRPFNFNYNNHKCSNIHNCTTISSRQFHLPKPPLFSSHNQTPSSHDDQEHPPQDAVLKAISEVSKAEGRVGQTTNVVIGGTVADDSTNESMALDQKVNSYPTVRGFTAIGTGGEDFVQAMVVAVESIIEQPIPKGHVKQKLSSGGKYVSVNIGPIQVVSGEQVQAVYNAMRRDDRVKYFL
ncbi:uncharacterized protein LOC113854802 isoform X2 [Abrus precatorius]|uniref:Uncharacterized protein LOC113854802 isoform X2 n=1 Tax=Abrus precatorius TaxID=3816 RepID=A0A8B8KDH6_ABRPR|nr:uncharacterized protein LOC113854802 isoform X2 [Abrus precatorius]